MHDFQQLSERCISDEPDPALGILVLSRGTKGDSGSRRDYAGESFSRSHGLLSTTLGEPVLRGAKFKASNPGQKHLMPLVCNRIVTIPPIYEDGLMFQAHRPGTCQNRKGVLVYFWRSESLIR